MTTKATNKVNNKVNNVNNENAKKISVNDIFANLQKVGVNLSLENTHRSVFKSELIKDLTDTQQKTFRRKARKLILALAESLVNYPNNEKLFKQFDETYKSLYTVNDYTLQSICSENMREKNKQVLQGALNIAKNFAKK